MYTTKDMCKRKRLTENGVKI